MFSIIINGVYLTLFWAEIKRTLGEEGWHLGPISHVLVTTPGGAGTLIRTQALFCSGGTLLTYVFVMVDFFLISEFSFSQLNSLRPRFVEDRKGARFGRVPSTRVMGLVGRFSSERLVLSCVISLLIKSRCITKKWTLFHEAPRFRNWLFLKRNSWNPTAKQVKLWSKSCFQRWCFLSGKWVQI